MTGIFLSFFIQIIKLQQHCTQTAVYFMHPVAVHNNECQSYSHLYNHMMI